ncbi:MAG: phytanoyl-CoA dioxygenase family protein [Akkermansiaceae bacterium]
MRALERKREFLASKGYLIVRNFFPREEIASLVTGQDAFYRGEHDLTPPFPWPKPRNCQARTRKHPYSSFFCSGIAELIRDGRLASLIKEAFSLDKIRFWHDQLLYDDPRTLGKADYHWHREESRWLTCRAKKMVTAWIPLVDFTPKMGPITMRPHNEPRRMALNAGDLVLFPSTTLHGNPPNFGDQPRRALAAHFASGDIRYQGTGNFSHVNERIVRKKNGLPDFQDPTVCPIIG